MAFAAAITDQFKQDILNGVHRPEDIYKIALGTQSAGSNCNKFLTNYSGGSVNMNGELPTAGGYTAGGIVLLGFTVGLSGDTAYIDWATDPTWNAATFTADMAVIYNSSRANKALVVLSFSPTTSTNAPFTVQLKPPGPTATITIS